MYFVKKNNEKDGLLYILYILINFELFFLIRNIFC